MAWPTVIDAIIDVIERNINMKVVNWYQPKYEGGGGEVVLTLYNGTFKSSDIDYIKIYVNEPDINCIWDVSPCYIWVDTKDWERLPIYRGQDMTPPKNDRWIRAQTIEVCLFFRVSEVGIPQYWDKKIRPVRKTDDPVQTPACAPDTG